MLNHKGYVLLTPPPPTHTHTVFYMSCTLAGVSDAKERDLRDWDIQETK